MLLNSVSVSALILVAALSVAARTIRKRHSVTYTHGAPPVFNNPRHRKAYDTLMFLVTAVALAAFAFALVALATK